MVLYVSHRSPITRRRKLEFAGSFVPIQRLVKAIKTKIAVSKTE